MTHRYFFRQLLDILTELRAYHNEQTELLTYQEKMLWEDIKQMPYLTSQNGIHDESLNSLLNTRGQSCMQRGEDESVLSCDITSERQMLAQKLQIDFGVSLQVLKNVENQAKEIRERMTKTKITTGIKVDFYSITFFKYFYQFFFRFVYRTFRSFKSNTRLLQIFIGFYGAYWETKVS